MAAHIEVEAVGIATEEEVVDTSVMEVAVDIATEEEVVDTGTVMKEVVDTGTVVAVVDTGTVVAVVDTGMMEVVDIEKGGLVGHLERLLLLDPLVPLPQAPFSVSPQQQQYR